MKEKPVQSDSFVIRVWREEGCSGWRGWVQHARSGESESIQDLEELLAFIERRTGKLVAGTRKGLK